MSFGLQKRELLAPDLIAPDIVGVVPACHAANAATVAGVGSVQSQLQCFAVLGADPLGHGGNDWAAVVGQVGSGIGLLLGQPSLYDSERLCRHPLIGGGVPSVLGPASWRLNIPVWKSAEKIKNSSFVKGQ